jgi:50S ribosomal protein L16 3-hydroxylase
METAALSQAELDSLPDLSPSLASMVAPIRPDDFRAHYWKQKVFFCPGSARRLASILRELGSIDIAKLLWQSRQYAVLWPESVDERHSSRLSTAGAVEAYEKRGATLYFRMKDSFPLARWTSALADELGEPPIGVTAFFAVRGQSGTRPHIDFNENFTIQIIGTKQWLVAPNEFITHPITNWTIGDPPPPYCHTTDLPTKMPAGALECRLTPGAVLYVPRGWFHHVTAIESPESLSLSMSLPPTPWALILATLLSNSLLEQSEFREALSGAFGNGWGRQKVIEQLPKKLAKLTQHVDDVGKALITVMEDPEKLQEYLVKRTHLRY